ncbi:alkylmercury lyase family protein [Nocardia huaxiensis]|uniref:Alkylmercury lyase family protein n=1 Tax=Nocardia huaxiensis TaxID=2755382 RepID=A0A7D6VGS0_9NOCA|nr:alkylmercury lyase family protein [Nocardia huaxiensis]QLY32457.1 alkylmercury lyase family protein [Nocardia huaxiensis]UFS93836.1 alkylmercury lyase family protein [Nocardia huaxiensis]
MAQLSTRARTIRQHIMDQVRATGTAPSIADLRTRFALSDNELSSDLRDLEGAICVARQDAEHADSPTFQDEPLNHPQPSRGELVYARPFATFENHYRITVDGDQRWFAECAVEACAISAQFPGAEVIVESHCRQTGQPIRLTGRDGVLLDFTPKTLRVHLGYPLREMPHRVVGWCDYNSFFASEEAAAEWQRTHPNIHGITRSPHQMSQLINETLGPGRLRGDYQPEIPLLPLLRTPARYGLTRSTGFARALPDPFWLPTPRMAVDWRRRLGSFIRFRVRPGQRGSRMMIGISRPGALRR